MRVLATGGTGVVGKAAVDHLLSHGHTVRLLSRHAESDAQQWPSGVEPLEGDVQDSAVIERAVADVDVVLHMAGIVAEAPPEQTFERLNVDATRKLALAAERGSVRRFIYVSSFGAERGASRYHRSKRKAEEVTAAICQRVPWIVARVGNVFGPGDQVLSLLLRMVRTLPVVPVVGDGKQPFQPVWADDLGEGLARLVELEGHDRETLNFMGPEVTNMHGVLDVFDAVTGRTPKRVPVPVVIARTGTAFADAVGLGLPIHSDELTMLVEGNVLGPKQSNALVDLLQVPLTPLKQALAALTEAQPEQLSIEGTGPLQVQRTHTSVRGARKGPEEMLTLLRKDFGALACEGAVSDASPHPLEVGDTSTLDLPVRGQVQVRVQEVTARSVTLVTLAGHPLAGAIRFSFSGDRDLLHLEVKSYTRAANAIDAIGMKTVGSIAQRYTWHQVLKRLAEASGGTPRGPVRHALWQLGREEAAHVDEWLRKLVFARKRAEAA
jgi:NADH dehydrogenase